MSTPLSHEQHPLNLIAAQYVLGVLSASARERVQTRMLREPELRDLVQYWERKLNPLAALVKPEQVPPQVWQMIDAAINHQTAPVSRPTPIVSAAPAPSAPANDGSWKLWTGLSSAVAAGLALFVVLRPDPTPQIIQSPPVIVQQVVRDLAVLSTSDNAPAWIVRQQDQQLVLTDLSAAAVPSDRDLELWSIQGSAAPRSLGVIKLKDGQAMLSQVQSDLISKDSILAISLEPTGGSPTGAPTGAVLYTGKIVRG